MVATAVCSVSIDPPSIVVGINRSASIWEVISETGRFTVSLLGAHHADLVPLFSGRLLGEERFLHGSWCDHETRVPYLIDALAVLFCEVDARLDYGSHTLFVGAIRESKFNESGSPLIWRDGQPAKAVSCAAITIGNT
jgi:flavin reductase (DIM6/NTAB) family NADH-FMN oxidoreductase RutF